MNLETLREDLKPLFEQNHVRMAYLFGSQATGKVHVESDVDFAVLLSEELTPGNRSEMKMKLIAGLSQICRTDSVDLVSLNEASPLLAYEVLRNGVLLYCADENTRIEFQVRTVRAYEDTAPLRKVLSEAMEERIRTGTFGKPILPRTR